MGHAAEAQSLLDVYEMALRNDPQLRSNLAAYQAQKAASSRAYAEALPSLKAEGQFSDSKQRQSLASLREVQLGEGAPVEFKTANQGYANSENTVYSLRLEQDIFSLPAWLGFRSAQQLSRQADALALAEAQQLILRVSRAYFDVLRAEENLRSARAEEAAIERQYALTRNRFSSGVGAATDVLEAESRRDLAYANRLSLQVELARARETLRAITGTTHEALWSLPEDFPITAPDPADIQEWTDIAMQNSYMIRANQLAVEAARLEWRARRMAHFPTISGEAVYRDSDREGDSFSFPFSEESEDTVWSLTLKVPLFTGGRLSAERRQSYHEYVQAREELVRFQRELRRQVRSLYQNLAIAPVLAEASHRVVQSAESALQSIRNGYQAGTRDIVDVLDAERNLYRSQNDYVNMRLDYLLNSLNLQEQAGSLDPMELERINQWLLPPGAQQR